MKVSIQISPYAGGLVCTIIDETHRYQLGQSRVFGPDNAQGAVEDAISSMLRRIKGEETGVTVLPPELIFK